MGIKQTVRLVPASFFRFLLWLTRTWKKITGFSGKSQILLYNRLMTIDEEIAELKARISTMYDDSPYYLGEDYETIQLDVLRSYMNTERAVELMIMIYFSIGLPLKTQKQFSMLSVEFNLLFKSVGFMDKVRYLENKVFKSEKQIEAYKKLNTYRNDFAHPDTFSLKRKYSTEDPQSKQKLRDLYRHLKYVNELTNNWFTGSGVYKAYVDMMSKLPVV